MNIEEAGKKLVSKRKNILIIELVSFVIGIIISLSLPKEYSVATVLVREKNNITSSDILMLNEFGILDLANIGISSSSNDAFSLFMYPKLFEDPTFRKCLLNITISKENGKPLTLKEYLKNDLNYPWWNKIVNKKLLKNVKHNIDQSGRYISIEDWEYIKILQDRVALLIDRKNLTITVNVTLQDPVIAYIVADSVSNYIQNYILNYRLGKAEQVCNNKKNLYTDARNMYFDSQSRYLNFLDSNNNLSSHKERVNRDILRTEKDLALNIYNQSAKQLQLAKAKVEDEKPAFFVLVPPIVPTKPSYPSKILVIIGFLIWGSVFSVWYTFK